jgi:hypothetical protein
MLSKNSLQRTVGRTLAANQWLAGSACGKRRCARPLNVIVRRTEVTSRVE